MALFTSAMFPLQQVWLGTPIPLKRGV